MLLNKIILKINNIVCLNVSYTNQNKGREEKEDTSESG